MKKKIVAITLAALLVLGLGTVALASTLPPNTGTGTIGFRAAEVEIIDPDDDDRIPDEWDIAKDLNLNFGANHLRNSLNTVEYNSTDRAGFAMINTGAPNITVSVQLSKFSSGMEGTDLILRNAAMFYSADPDDAQDDDGVTPVGNSALIRAGETAAAHVFAVTQEGLHAGNWAGTLIVPPTAVQNTGTQTATMTWIAADTPS